MSLKMPERFRDSEKEMRVYKTAGDATCGLFTMAGPKSRVLACIASSGGGWEHVSVHLYRDLTKVPTWQEMCFVKGLFWDDEDCVVQYHPRKSEYVNMHQGVLHLWRPTEVEMPRPPKGMV